MSTRIKRELPFDEYQAAVGANNASASNVFATIADIPLVASGIWGISNSTGVYTYYATLTLAMAAAVAGNTIELFADVIETTSVSPNLKPGVVINGNGHTYTHTSTTGDTFTLTTTGLYTFTNINIKRTVTTPTAAVIFGNTAAPFFQVYSIVLNSSYVEYTWTATTGAISLVAGSNSANFNFEGLNALSNGSGYMLTCYGLTRNCKLENTSTGGCITTSNFGNNILENLYLKTVSGNCLFMNYGGNSIRNSTAITTSGNAIGGQSGASAYDCFAISSTGKAFSGVNAYNCTGQTDTGNAYYQCNTYNCSGRSTTGYTVVPYFSASKNYNGSFYSSGASVGYSPLYCIDFYNSSVVTDSTSNAIVSGNAYGTTPTYINNYIQVGAVAAYCISSPGNNIRYSGNQFANSTTPISPTTIQVVTNTSDNQGNLLVY